jgi:hypothetical protein
MNNNNNDDDDDNNNNNIIIIISRITALLWRGSLRVPMTWSAMLAGV